MASLAGDLTNISGQFAASKKEATVANIVEGELVSAYQTLTEEMKRLLKSHASRPKSEAIGGIPVDSEYIIFIVDTSASMTSAHWKQAQQTVQEILSIYPSVKGMQIMDDEGKVMIAGTRGQWITDLARTASADRRAHRQVARLQQLESCRGHRGGDQDVLGARQAHQPVCARRRVHGRLDPAGVG